MWRVLLLRIVVAEDQGMVCIASWLDRYRVAGPHHSRVELGWHGDLVLMLRRIGDPRVECIAELVHAGIAEVAVSHMALLVLINDSPCRSMRGNMMRRVVDDGRDLILIIRFMPSQGESLRVYLVMRRVCRLPVGLLRLDEALVLLWAPGLFQLDDEAF